VIYIWIRATTDWTDERAFRAQLEDAFRPKVDVWDATFDMPYHVFRHRLKRIAAQSLARVEGATCAEWDAIPEGALVVPTDDDDWLAPDLAKALEAERDDATACIHWTSSFIEVPTSFGHWVDLVRRAIFPRTPPMWICTTNNYAMVKCEETRRLLQGHTHASRWVLGPGADRTRRIEGRLSVMNRTLASQTSLAFRRPDLTRAELVSKYRKYARLYTRRVPEGLAWCRPYLGMMAELMGELKLRG